MKKPSKLKLMIYEKGLVQADVAQAAYMSESRLSRILNGRVVMQEHERKNIARVLGMATVDLPR